MTLTPLMVEAHLKRRRPICNALREAIARCGVKP
jgi:hypothetical protein